jgi:adenosine deaminase CECR1
MLPRTLAVLLLLISAAWGQSPALSFEDRFQQIVKEADREQLYRFLWALPKGGDLHHHFSLAVPADVWLRAATEAHGNLFYTRLRTASCTGDTAPFLRFLTVQRSTWAKLPPCRQAEYTPMPELTESQKAEWMSSFVLDKSGEGRDEFFEAIVPRMGEINRDPKVLADAVTEMLRRTAAEGVRYVETQYWPVNLMDATGRPLSENEGAEIVRGILERPEVKSTGIQVRLQAALIRFRPDAELALERAYRFVDRHRDLWKGINLVGREDNEKGYALRFLDTFRKMRREYPGIHLSIHAGEMDSPGREVRNTLLLGAERIGHGVNLITDPEGMLLARTGKFLVETQLISNKLLEYTPDLSKHPFPEYLRTGIPVCLNTDDPMAWDSNLTDEYVTAVTTFHLSWDEVVGLGRNSLSFSFAEPPLKKRMMEEYERDVLVFEKRMHGDWKAELKKVQARPSGYAKRVILAGR